MRRQLTIVPTRAGTPFTDEDDAAIHAAANTGRSLAEVAAALDRHPWGVQRRAEVLKVTLKGTPEKIVVQTPVANVGSTTSDQVQPNVIEELDMMTDDQAATGGDTPTEGKTRGAGKKRAKKTAARPRTKAQAPRGKGGKGRVAGKAARGTTKTGGPKGDGLGRPGSTYRFMAERLVKGQDTETIAAAAKKAFPKAASTEKKHVLWVRWKLVQQGVLKAPK